MNWFVCRRKALLKSFSESYLECSMAHPATEEVAPILCTDLKTLAARKLPLGGTASTIWRGSSSTNALAAVRFRRKSRFAILSFAVTTYWIWDVDRAQALRILFAAGHDDSV